MSTLLGSIDYDGLFTLLQLGYLEFSQTLDHCFLTIPLRGKDLDSVCAPVEPNGNGDLAAVPYPFGLNPDPYQFLYADDCSAGLYKIMSRFDFFFKKKEELHLTTSKRISIIDIANIIKKILKKRGIKITIKPSKKRDELQNNVNNKSNNFLLNYWKPKFTIESGIESIINYYD